MGPALEPATINTMAARIRRFVQDRTELLTAIGHDLRTPITRLKLRAEFVEDEEQRGKILADLAVNDPTGFTALTDQAKSALKKTAAA